MKIRERKTLNKPLIRKLALKLRRMRHEEHYNQGVWFQKTDCGTAACIAGHVVAMAGLKFAPPNHEREQVVGCFVGKREEMIDETAAALLGVPHVNSLFSSDPAWEWPEEFGDRWRNRDYTGERPSRIAADYLDAIADGKAQP